MPVWAMLRGTAPACAARGAPHLQLPATCFQRHLLLGRGFLHWDLPVGEENGTWGHAVHFSTLNLGIKVHVSAAWCVVSRHLLVPSGSSGQDRPSSRRQETQRPHLHCPTPTAPQVLRGQVWVQLSSSEKTRKRESEICGVAGARFPVPGGQRVHESSLPTRSGPGTLVMTDPSHRAKKCPNSQTQTRNPHNSLCGEPPGMGLCWL